MHSCLLLELIFSVYREKHNYGDSDRKPTIFDIKEYFISLTTAQKSLLSQVCRVIELVLVMPATNATSERSFSALQLMIF